MPNVREGEPIPGHPSPGRPPEGGGRGHGGGGGSINLNAQMGAFDPQALMNYIAQMRRYQQQLAEQQRLKMQREQQNTASWQQAKAQQAGGGVQMGTTNPLWNAKRDMDAITDWNASHGQMTSPGAFNLPAASSIAFGKNVFPEDSYDIYKAVAGTPSAVAVEAAGKAGNTRPSGPRWPL